MRQDWDRDAGHHRPRLFSFQWDNNDSQDELPGRQQPPAAKYGHIALARTALSCPDCGEPMSYGFRKVCRRCDAKLVMIQQIFHPGRVRVFVAGPTAALYRSASRILPVVVLLGFWFAILVLLAICD